MKFHPIMTQAIDPKSIFIDRSPLKKIKICKQFEFKVALYSGYELWELDPKLVGMLDYIKCGSYIEELGGLDKKGTNQRLWKRVDGELVDITAEMQRE